MTAYDIIKKPVLTEKSYAGIQDKRYIFIVEKSANKLAIKKAVEDIFGVEVESVNTISIKGKYKRRGKAEGYTSDYKKAMVALKEGSKPIEFFNSLS